MKTLRQIADQVLQRWAGFAPGESTEVHYDEIYPYIAQQVNAMIKAEQIRVRIPSGDNYVHEGVIGIYPSIPVVPMTEHLAGQSAQFGTFTGVCDLVVTDLGGQNRHIALSGFTIPPGEDSTSMLAFLTNLDQTGWLTLDGMSVGVPRAFASSAITNITVSFTSIEFDYDLIKAGDALPTTRGAIIADVDSLKRILTYEGTLFKRLVRHGDNINNNVTTIHGMCRLPVQPISLPRGMGLWRIYDPNDPNTYIVPLRSGKASIAYNVTHTGLSDLLSSRLCYEWQGGEKVVFNKEVKDLPTTVTIELVVVDVTNIGDFDPLPIPADYEADVVENVFKALAASRAPDYSLDKTQDK